VSSTRALHAALGYARVHAERALADLVDWLAIPSESADPARAGDVRAGAGWLAGHLREGGFAEVAVLETPGHPAVYGRAPAGDPHAPTLLLYGHYDVQPVDPVREWTSPPYRPVLREGNLYARGATDDKGQLFALVTGVCAYLRAGQPLPVHVVVLAEGEEEVSSPHLGWLLERERRRLACDAVVLADQPMFDRRTPLVLYGVRGSAYLQLDVRGPAVDLHSGTFGGAVDNPASVLARILAALQDGRTRRVLVPGFYDAVRELDPAERAELAAAPVTDELALALTGAPALAGEQGYPLAERIATRPTFEVHGLLAGHTSDDGKKTVVPARAMAKVSWRLVPDQDPDDIIAKVRGYLDELTPPTVRLSVRVLGRSHPAVMGRDSAVNRAVARAYRDAMGADPRYLRGGGSEPAVWQLQRVLGVPVCMIGFGLPTDNAHAPDEHLAVDLFHQGVQVSARLLWAYRDQASQESAGEGSA
jgi:acetylornithine deacetylase/succinyl-diaminopimelate desuccinylase-like protein